MNAPSIVPGAEAKFSGTNDAIHHGNTTDNQSRKQIGLTLEHS